MNFRRRHHESEPEINLIPLIDVLLVMLIFLAVATSFKQVSELEVSLPELSQSAAVASLTDLNIAVGEDGSYAINGKLITARDTQGLAKALQTTISDIKQTRLIIHADAAATHQSVVNVLEAARLTRLTRVNFAANAPATNQSTAAQ